MRLMVAAVRMALGLACLSLTVLAMASAVELLPDRTRAEQHGRRSLCEVLAVCASEAAERGGLAAAEGAVRRALVSARHVASVTAEGPGEAPPADHAGSARFPVLVGGESIGTITLRFTPPPAGHPMLSGLSQEARFVGFFILVGFCFEALYLWAVMSRITPENDIPDRVRATLDTLSEGVLLLDDRQKVALANRAFAAQVGLSAEQIEGCDARDLPWLRADDGESSSPGDGVGESPDADDLPWERALRDGNSQNGQVVGLRGAGAGRCTLSVNATPIVDERGEARGVLATFADQTEISRRNESVRRLIEKLRRARRDVRNQNRMLRGVSAVDGATGCLSKRSFEERLEAIWRGEPASPGIGCVVVRVERIAGLVAGQGLDAPEEAVRRASQAVGKAARESDTVGRIRPDTLCVVLPGGDMAAAESAAERFRKAIAAVSSNELPLTVRVGTSARTPEDDSPGLMLGRAELDLETRPLAVADAPAGPGGGEPDVQVSYHAVTSLVSALAYRDVSTAEHSRRVADLCVAVARGLTSERACYLLEVGALLHDIGKLGVPDAVLRKPGPLNEEEWVVMGSHDRLGVEIISAAFGSLELSDIVRYHHAWFGGNPREPDLPTGDAIPLGARILSIADAYDAMVSDRVYRKGKSRDYAFQELTRCGGRQFDPAIVDRFIAVVTARDEARPASAPVPPISKRAAFKIGLQIEKLADALDSRDLATLSVMAERLRGTAEENGVPAIARTAELLAESLKDKDDWFHTLELTCDLLELCRSTQSTYLETYQRYEDATSFQLPQATSNAVGLA